MNVFEDSFISLLDTSSFKLDSLDKCCEYFKNIASNLFYDFKLRTRTGDYRITCVEFYISGISCINDPITHKKDEQLDCGTFYVHRKGNTDSFNAPKYSGIDITCGSRSKVIHGGILGGILIGNRKNKRPKFILQRV